MTEQVYLAIDLGAESGRVMAGLWNGKRMQLEEVHRFPNEPMSVADGLHWDVAKLWWEIQNGLSIAARRYGKKIVSVGVDTWGVDFALLSKNFEVLGQPYTYRDSRTTGLIEEACRQVPRSEIFAETGLQFLEINTLYQLLALQKNSPGVLKKAQTLLLIPDFFHWCLCGARVVEFTNATTTQFFHPEKRDWSRQLLKKFNLPTKILPEIVFPGTDLGTVRSSVLGKTGLRKMSVVAPATHDTASAVAAVPVVGRKSGSWAYISSGTWSLVGIEIPKANLSSRVLELNLTNEGGVDKTYRLLKNIMGLWLVQQCKRAFEKKRRSKIDYSELISLAESESSLSSLVNPDDKRFLNPPDMPLAIQQFCRETGQPIPESEGALVRCALESLALAYQKVLSELEEVNNERIEVIHIVGGGSRNDLLNQFTADACERRVIAGPVEATSLGNLLVQARASGEVLSLEELRTIVIRSSELREFKPASNNSSVWQKAKSRFAEICHSAKASNV